MEMKKTVKVNFIGFWNSFNKEDNLFYNILSKKYIVEISDNPDYLFVSPLGKAYDFMKYDCIRIYYSGEEIVPDFNLFDYAIGFDDIEFGDRYIRYPFCFMKNDSFWSADKLSAEKAEDILSKKDIFCNLIYNEDSVGGYRKELFEALCRYKKVDAYGRYLNNVNGNGISYLEKREILRRSKFTIAVEGCNYLGVTTEKITHPFEEHSIPIFFGNKNINSDFNENAFVNCHSFSSIEDVVNRIIELDNDDDLYLDMLTSSPLVNDDYAKDKYYALEDFLYNIFDQDLNDCKRRVDSIVSRHYNTHIAYSRYIINNKVFQYITNKIDKR